MAKRYAQSNRVISHGTDSIKSTAGDDFMWFDLLPKVLQHVLQEFNQNFSSLAAFDVNRRKGVDYSLYAIEYTERADIMRFAREYHRAYSLPYPHVEADVSIQRYGTRGPFSRKVTHLNARQRQRLRAARLTEIDEWDSGNTSTTSPTTCTKSSKPPPEPPSNKS